MSEQAQVTLTIDGRQVSVGPGTTVLQAARRLDITIPTLCYHEALTPEASCRSMWSWEPLANTAYSPANATPVAKHKNIPGRCRIEPVPL